jgi:putative Holliday junction resolvase
MPEARGQVILAFDFGLRRIGIASGDSISGTAAPHAAVLVGDHGVDWEAIGRVLQQFRPAVLVVGSPRNEDGSAGALGAAADRFAAALARHSGLTVHRADEYGSSLEAAATLREHRASGQRRRRVRAADIDSAAAAIILERYLGHSRATDD